jgi:RNA polymerase sigma factor (sigma-70 family)
VTLDEELGVLVRERGHHLIRVAYQLTHDGAAAEDIVQEALIGVCRSWRGKSGRPERLEAYVRRAMINEFLKKRSRRASSDLLTDAPDGISRYSFEEVLVERDELWRALELLSPRQRVVLVLRFYEQLPDAEIASIAGCRQATVRSLAARALSALRIHLAASAAMSPGSTHAEGPS